MTINNEIKMNNKQFRFGIYTSFYNAENFIDKIFDSVSKINYTNFKWIITDDFSVDNTKNLLLEKIKSYDFVEYAEQKHKKEMYWQPNKFFDTSYDYIVLLDCDDDFDFNFLNIYNKFANLHKDAIIITSDFIKKQNDSFHSLSLVKNDELLIHKLNNFHPEVNYLNNISYNCIGHLRCFKNLPFLNFEINDFDACAEDSYRMMYLNNLGKWLHIPRTLYQWNLRKDSESHSVVKSNFNGNFNLAYEKIKYNNFHPYYTYNDIYKETSAFSILGINELKNKKISIFSKSLSTEQKNKLQFIYSDSRIKFDAFDDSDVFIINGEYYINSNFITTAIDKIKQNHMQAKIVIYYQEDSYFDSSEQMANYISDNFNKLKSKIHNFSYHYYTYFRHNYIVL